MTVVKFTDNSGKTVLAVSLEDGYYMDENGRLRYGETGNVSRARNVPAEIRKELLEMGTLYHKKKKLLEKYKKIQEDYNKQFIEIDSGYGKCAEAIRNIKGVLTEEEFAEEFYQALPDKTRKEMEYYGYAVQEPTGICYKDGNLYISREKLLMKYCRNVPYVYEEYDGSLFMIDDAEKDATYQKTLKEASKPLTTKMKIRECLFPGDKLSIWYSGTYEIEVKKGLTKEYAKELAKKFAA